MVAHSRASLRTDRLRALNVPRAVQVAVDDRGLPTMVDDNAVEEVLETWRIDDEWWREPISREYRVVILDDGRSVTLYHDLLDGRWYAQKGD